MNTQAKIALLLMAILASGCATLHKPPEMAVGAAMDKLNKAPLDIPTVVGVTDELKALYRAEKTKLENDLLLNGDFTTLAGIAAAAAAIGKAHRDVLVAIGFGVAVPAAWDVRYRPSQQRVIFNGVIVAMDCVAGKANEIDLSRRVLLSLAKIAFGDMSMQSRDVTASTRLAASTASITQAVDQATDAPKTIASAVRRIHYNLEDKLFAVVTTQGYGEIRDSIVKDAIAAGKRADEIRNGQQPLIKYSGQAPALAAQNELERAAREYLAKAETLKSDLDICITEFAK